MKNYSPPPDLLKGRVILITGASSGLGRLASLAYARHGATVALLGREENKLEAVYDEIVGAGYPEPAMFPFDLAVADDRGLENLAGVIGHHLQRLDGILHSAYAFTNLSPLHLQTMDQWQMLIKVNLIAPFGLTRACLPFLQAAPDASVIFTGDTHGHHPAAYWGGYAIAKSGIETLTKL
jgi:NAD(P)-dependent dehydrogenase (short-subunit alcohol dehydrogenase family)